MAVPLAFTMRDNIWALSAVLGLSPNENLFVSSSGQWIGVYVPAIFRAYPFRTGWTTDGEAVLCIDEASGMLTEDATAEPFFDEAGEPSATLKQVWSFLQETARSEAELAAASQALYAAEVIEPWPIEVQATDGPRTLAGLYRINEAALNSLNDASFGQLRRAGVVALAYAQLLSMGNLATLGKLTEARAVAQAQAEAAERARAAQTPMITLPADSTIDWDWSRIGRG